MEVKRIKNSIPYLVIAAVCIFMFRGIFAPGFMSGNDNSLHYYDVYYLTKTLIPQYHWISGWSMQGMAGFPVMVDYYQTGHLAIAFLNKILRLDLLFSYKTMVLSSYIILGWGFFKIAKDRFGKTASLLFSLCILLQQDVYEKILIGMWNNYLALGIFFVFFHFLDKYAEKLNLRRAALLGLLLALLILTHAYTAIFAFLLLAIYFVFYIKKSRAQKKPLLKAAGIYAIIPISAILASSYYICGFIVGSGYFREMANKDLAVGLIWSAKSFFGPLIQTGNIPADIFINLPVFLRVAFSFLGIYMFFTREKDPGLRRFLGATLIFMITALVLFSDILPNTVSWWHKVPLIGKLQTNRFLIYLQVSLYIFACYGFFCFLRRFRKKAFILTALIAGIFFSLFSHYIYFVKDETKTLNASREMPDVYKVWDWVNGNVPPGETRVVYQNTILNSRDPILQRSDVFALSGVFTKVPQIYTTRPASPFPQEEFMRSDQGLIFSRNISLVNAGFIKDMMEYFNAGYIVTVEPNLRLKLEESALFEKKAAFGDFAIFKLGNFKGKWIDFEKGARYKILKFENQDVMFDIKNTHKDNRAFIKIAYHPFWRARLNGKLVKIGQDDFALMRIALPESTDYRLELVFNSFNPLLVCVSFFSMVICVVLAICAKKS